MKDGLFLLFVRMKIYFANVFLPDNWNAKNVIGASLQMCVRVMQACVGRLKGNSSDRGHGVIFLGKENTNAGTSSCN